MNRFCHPQPLSPPRTTMLKKNWERIHASILLRNYPQGEAHQNCPGVHLLDCIDILNSIYHTTKNKATKKKPRAKTIECVIYWYVFTRDAT